MDITSNYQPSEVPFEVPSSNEATPEQDDDILVTPGKEDEILITPINILSPRNHETKTLETETHIPYSLRFEIPSSNELTYEQEDEILVIPEQKNGIPVPISSPEARNHQTETHIPYSLRLGTPSSIVTHKDIGWLSDAGVRGSISTVFHGTYNSEPATLILFTFVFRSGDRGFCFKNANVKINFSKHSSSSSSKQISGTKVIQNRTTENWNPEIVQLAPRKIYGLPTTTSKTQKISGEISLQVPLTPLTIGPSLSSSNESSFSLSHCYSITGNFWSSARDSGWDIAYWDLKENKRTKEGIPDRLNVGVLVKRGMGGRFQADVEVKVDTPVLKGVFGFPWRRERPVIFEPGTEVGAEGVRTRAFEKLGDADWRGMIPWEEDWEDVVTGPSGTGELPSANVKS